ncbi:hypothetical protein L2725_09645 [Shewanella corallii]|uniref:Uncharacterized protein n=1 Tax=Shewanella corallii TaxID=560080 RepID=A0ABT0N6G9_9GAMM|nr:hypothetical protein [Shewanella corallii]MCL2914051.1 hypothetical protein [Shewanella corallii]
MVLFKILGLQVGALVLAALFLNVLGRAGDWPFEVSILFWIGVACYCLVLLHRSLANGPDAKINRVLVLILGYMLSILPVTLGGYMVLFIFAVGSTGFK